MDKDNNFEFKNLAKIIIIIMIIALIIIENDLYYSEFNNSQNQLKLSRLNIKLTTNVALKQLSDYHNCKFVNPGR